MKSNRPVPAPRPAPRRSQDYQVEDTAPTSAPPPKPPRAQGADNQPRQSPQHLPIAEAVPQPSHSESDRPPTPAGWDSKYWHQVTDPKLLRRAANRVAHRNEYYALAKAADFMCILCFVLLVVLVIVVGNIPSYLN